MGLFSKAKKNDAWLALAFLKDGIGAGRVKRVAAGKPVVELAAFFPAAHSPEALEKLGKELQAQHYRIATVLGGGEYQMINVDAPNVPPEELKTAVGWRLKDMLDFPVAEATIDVLDIPQQQNGAQRGQQLFAVAARNSVIAPRQGLFSAARMALSVIDIPEMAQRNISALLEPQGRGLALLSFGADGGLLTVTYNGELYLSRRIDVSLEQLLEPDSDKQHACHDKITLELQRSLDHFERQFHFIAVAKLVLAPTGAQGLHEYLASNLYMPVEALDLADVLDLGKTDLHDPASQQRVFLALGAALRDLEGAP
ncbi:type IV pilus biogenesis protein PilM [Janthinobacterium fluminis]|uniref:Agglutinin biogenesis protein MshI n=1 Tax=Janthinobacterium fluminis TaxID=2987524 RepID=A0ABT5K5W4_9BURK|nr:agglutinin biogenesis protein MshI [Janthinobacterium fluminis]MDC8760396.1 agglutinin biogenesis protein MshI [Janthinobacterium fluminis]